MLHYWSAQLGKVFRKRELFAARRSPRFRRGGEQNPSGALVSQVEVLELRQMLTNVVAVHLQGGTLHLTDVSSHNATTGDSFSISYTSSQVVLTGQNGTSFKVGNEILTSYTLSVSTPISLSISLNRNANSVTLTGDGSASLVDLSVNLGAGRQANTFSLTNVIADSVSFNGGGRNSSVTVSESQIHQDLWAHLGYWSGNRLDLETSTVSGNVTDYVGKLVVNHSTISGKLTDLERGSNSIYNSTDSTYTGNVLVWMGKDGVTNYLYSPDGSNQTHGKVTFIGAPRHKAQIYQGLGSTANNIPPTIIYGDSAHLIHTDEQVVPGSSSSVLTVNALAAATTTPTITGTYSPANSSVLSVTVNGTTYTLGKDSQLTAPSSGQWSLDLSGSPLPVSTTSFTVTALSTDQWGNPSTATGTVTNEQAIINKYLTSQNLKSTDVETSSGLNYVITTKGTGALPKAGQTIAATYTGYILNQDGTLGSEFDSNIDGTHPSDPNPFTFPLGQGSVIKGWDEAFALLPVGSSATLIIPSALAYGTAGSGTSIPANSILVFNVKLISAT